MRDWNEQPTALSYLKQDMIRDEVKHAEIAERLKHFAARAVRRSLNRHLAKGGVVLKKDVTIFAKGERDGQMVLSLVDSEMKKLYVEHGVICELLLLRGESIPAIASSLVLRLTLGFVLPDVWEVYFSPTAYQLPGCQKPKAPIRYKVRKVRYIQTCSPIEALLQEMKSQCSVTEEGAQAS